MGGVALSLLVVLPFLFLILVSAHVPPEAHFRGTPPVSVCYYSPHGAMCLGLTHSHMVLPSCTLSRPAEVAVLATVTDLLRSLSEKA